MTRLIVIGEGATEQAFCKDILEPHFLPDLIIHAVTIKKSRGGIVHWSFLKKQIEEHLKQDQSAYVTLFIDYYGIKDQHEFPSWEAAQAIPGKSIRMDHLEGAMSHEITEGLRRRFIPYIQLHETEGLLFSDKRVYDESFTQEEFDDYTYLEETFNQFDNPEEINDGPDTHPSKRLERILRDYTSNKPSTKAHWGPLIATEIGLPTIRRKCPRFNAWVEKLENI
ncbi:MAG: hypothetical protein CMB80_34100 [Flammeovirgaceae bacterium]|nr:hypothetical protein [Flammeovirgaceae bacterium]HCX24376.1 hypothetical protein [Cytophagales bacterium]|tara:strand:+ start:263 stop:934 length:672 start_codon:yes stop_codon:yes gene_type:complete